MSAIERKSEEYFLQISVLKDSIHVQGRSCFSVAQTDMHALEHDLEAKNIPRKNVMQRREKKRKKQLGIQPKIVTFQACFRVFVLFAINYKRSLSVCQAGVLLSYHVVFSILLSKKPCAPFRS